jgi:hypothetical protein
MLRQKERALLDDLDEDIRKKVLDKKVFLSQVSGTK